MSVELTDDFELIGEELTLEDAEAMKVAGQKLISAGDQTIRIDLTQLERANSITVAVLVAWYRAATIQEKSIVFVNLPQELREIVEFSGLSKLLLPPTPGL